MHDPNIVALVHLRLTPFTEMLWLLRIFGVISMG